MRLRHLELENFLSHQDEQVSLPATGLFFLDGESGFGKSSMIVDGVGYVLFGAKATRAKQDELRSRGHDNDVMRVRCDFEFDDGSVLALERGLTPKGAAFARASDEQGRLLAEGAAPVERLVRQRLGGLSWQQFYTAYVARQSDVDALLTATPSRRKEIVHRMLGVREIEIAEKEAHDQRTRVRVELDRLQAQIGERTKPVLEQRKVELEGELSTATQAFQAGEQRLAGLRARRSEIEGLIAPLQSAAVLRETVVETRRRIEARRPHLADLARRVESAAAAKALLTDETQINEELARTEEALTEARTRWERLAEHERLTSERAAAIERLNERRMARVSVPASGGSVALEEQPLPTPDEVKARLQVAAAERQMVAAERARREQHQAQLCDDDSCPTCQRPFEGAEREHVLSDIEQALAELGDRERELRESEQTLRALLPEAEKAAQERAEQATEIARAEAQIGVLDEQVAALDAASLPDKETLREEGVKLRERADELRQQRARRALAREQLDEGAAAEHEALQLEQRQDEEALGAAEEQLKDAPDPAELPRLREEQSLVATQVARTEGELPGLQASRARAERDLKSLVEELQALEGLYRAREEAHETALCLEQLAEILDSYKSALAREIRPALELMASEVLRQVSQGRFANVIVGEDYEVEVERDDGEVLQAQLLSGGERTRLALSFRLALTRLVSERTGVPLRLIVLDESLSSSDPGHIEATVDVLDALRDVFQQVFLISHVGDLKEQAAVDYVLSFAEPGSARRVELQYA